MKPALADRLCRALVGCYPRRWKQRYAAEMLDVLDQHPAGPRTVLSLAGAALTTHLDPGYRTEIRLMPRLSKNVKLAVVMSVAVPAALFALVATPVIAQNISESSWHLSNSGAVGPVAFSGDRRILAGAADGPPWSGTSILWDDTNQAQPRRLAEFEGGNPTTISPDGRTVATIAFGGQPILWNVTRPRHPARLAVLSAGLAGGPWGEAFSPSGRLLAAASTSELELWNVAHPARPRLLRTLAATPVQTGNPGDYDLGDGDLVFSPDGRILASASGTDQITLWNVTRPARATPIATLPGPGDRPRPGDYFTALAFSPRANLLAGVTFHGRLLVFRLSGPGHPVQVTTRPRLLASARFPGGRGGPADPCHPGCATAAYAIGFTPDGHSLTVVIDRSDAYPSTTDRDTIFTWQVASSGTLSDPTTIFRNVSDAQPTLAPGTRIVADGSELGGKVHLWTLP
jgi:WD40 repeat protein